MCSIQLLSVALEVATQRTPLSEARTLCYLFLQTGFYFSIS